MNVYFNEFDPKAAAWIRSLQDSGHATPGTIDTKSISDVHPGECGDTSHFFAGIGGWDLALRLAEWPTDRPVWTGSCPCQPFSAAGKGLGEKDPRHLWPEFRRLIAERRPPIIFGEQVASAAGRVWLSRVRADLEALGYAVGAADLCAAGIGAPHIRQRLFWMAVAERKQKHEEQLRPSENERGWSADSFSGCGLAGGVVQSDSTGPQPREPSSQATGYRDTIKPASGISGMGRSESNQQRGPRESRKIGGRKIALGGSGSGCWDDYEWIPCRDGKSRRIKSGLEPLAHGVPGRVVRLRGYGNAIVPALAAEFIKAAKDWIGGTRV